jgi:phage shock protein PspC (stress-responsive transcriptional regulator)
MSAFDCFSKVRRSRTGLVLGVFKGIAECRGWNVVATRVIGTVALLSLSGVFGGRDLSQIFVAAFFYLLLAVLIPAESSDGSDSGRSIILEDLQRTASRTFGTPIGGGISKPEDKPETGTFSGADLILLNEQMSRLNRRIQRMEGLVTNRDYEWERRMRSGAN